MHKRQLALLVLSATTGATFAQSSVTIYGVVDMGIQRTNGGTTNTAAGATNGNAAARGFPANRVWAVGQGIASRLGFMGREDLGGGSYARFDIQHRFSPDTGAAASPFWAARSVVAVGSATLGEIYLGREYTPASWIGIYGDPTAWNYVSRFEATYTLAGYGSGSTTDQSYLRNNNMFGYKSANIAGLVAEVSVSAREGFAPKAGKSATLTYKHGPLFAIGGFDAMDNDNRLIGVTAAYDFGVARLSVNYADAKGGFVNTGSGGALSPNYRARSGTVAATFPLSRGLAFVGAGFYDPTDSGTGVSGTISKSNKFSAGYKYLLSKRTNLYVTGSTAKKDDRGTVRFTRSTAFDVGVTHSF